MQEIEKEGFLHTIKDINYFFNLKKNRNKHINKII
jgi:hypothetical protein